MLDARREKIVELIKEQGGVSISNLSNMLEVSEMTIHRDLDFLENMGLLQKKRGVAVLVEAPPVEKVNNYSHRLFSGICLKEKEAIAEAACKLITDRDTIIFDNSTTAFEVAKRIKDLSQLTVYATNPDVFNELLNCNNMALYCCGGLYSSQTSSFVGSAAEDFVSRLRVSKCVIGASGITCEYGLTDPYPLDASLKRKIISVAQQVIVVADYMKIGKVALEKVMDIKDIDYLITDSKADKDLIHALKKRTEVIVCDVQ